VNQLRPGEITDAFRACGVGEGDTLMLHSDAIIAAQMPGASVEDRLETIFQEIFAALPGGTLVVPTFSYSFTKGIDFDPAHTPSDVGMLTEYFRKRQGTVRTRQPIFSLAATGPLAQPIADSQIADCFGLGSAFDLLHEENAWLACLACGFDRITMVHYVEQLQQVNYRYFKDFAGNIVEAGQSRPESVRYFVRDLNRDTGTDLTRLRDALVGAGQLTSAPVGRFSLIAVQAKHFYEQACSLLQRDSTSLIREGNRKAISQAS
jgi:aminoglycoside 3-N-acetyltransferase